MEDGKGQEEEASLTSFTHTHMEGGHRQEEAE